MSARTSITVSRKATFLEEINVGTQAPGAYTIIIDERKASEVKVGKTVDIPVNSGKHSMHIKIGWYGSQTIEFDIKEGQNIKFECGSNFTGWGMFVAVIYIFLPREWIWIQQVT